MPMRSLLLAVLVLPLAAQAPAIAFDRTHAALGRISPGQKQRVAFRVSNAGDAPLQISEVLPSCGCTTTLSGSLVLQPGEGREIEAVLDPQGMKGPLHKSLAVRSNDPRTPTVNLILEAEVVPEVQAVPEELFFHSVPRRGRQVLTLDFRSSAGEDLRILEATSPAPYISSTPRPGTALLDVTVEGERLPPGLRSGHETLTVRTTSAPMPTLSLPVYWVLQPVFTAAPTEVSFGTVTPGRRHARSLVLAHAGGRPFRVTGARTTSERFQVALPAAKAAPRQTLTLVLPKGSPRGSVSEVLLIEVDDPDESLVAVPVRADIR